MRFSNTLRCDGLPERGVLLSRLMGGFTVSSSKYEVN